MKLSSTSMAQRRATHVFFTFPRKLRVAVWTSTLLVPVPAAAAGDGFALNRFDPAERGGHWFALDSLDIRGDRRVAAGVSGDWAHRPLVLFDANGNEVQALVANQMYAHVGGSIVFDDRWRVGVSVPVVALSSGEAAAPGAPSLPVTLGSNMGDVRVGVDARVYGKYGDPFTVAVGAQVYLPTGSRRALTGDGALRLQPHAALSGHLGKLEVAARTGVNLRAVNEFSGAEVGSEWAFGAAAGLRVLGDRLLVGPEFWGSTLIDSSLGAFNRTATPTEVLMGAHYSLDAWALGVGVGPGLSRGLGAPELRALASVEWAEAPAESQVIPPPPAAPSDIDGDRIADDVDQCPQVPGPAQSDPVRTGCPIQVDSDGDGWTDEHDACPVEPAAPGDTDGRGCPVSDRDGDGIADPADACIDEPGVASEVSERNGCPSPPDAPSCGGSGQPACDQPQVQGDHLRGLDRIEFENAKDALRPSAEPILMAVVELLEAHPEITKLEIEGHTDARGQREANVSLSQRRAEAVKRWLIGHGIDATRMSARGYGPDKPVDSNDTDAGRQANRRVEFRILDGQTP